MVVDDKIQQIAFMSGTVTYHECLLSEVNFEGQYIYAPQNNSIYYNETPSPTLRDVMSRKGESKNKVTTMPKRANSIQNPITNPPPMQNPSTYVTNERSRKLIGKRTDAIAR